MLLDRDEVTPAFLCYCDGCYTTPANSMELHYQCVHLALLLEEIYIIFNKPYQTMRKIPLATQ